MSYVNKTVDFLEDRIVSCTRKDKIINIALSGGTTPVPILQKLALRKIPWEKIKFYIVDERCVSASDMASNYKTLNECFFKLINTEVSLVYIEELGGEVSAKKYNEQIKNIQFDLILLGMGNDGHIASLFPNTNALDEKLNSVVYNEVLSQKYNRITFTYPILLKGKEIIFLIRGEQKNQLLNLIFEKDDKSYPVTKIINKGKNITWLVEE